MVKKTFFLLSFFFGVCLSSLPLHAFSFQVIEGEFLWISPNLIRQAPTSLRPASRGTPTKKKESLRFQSFRNHFDRFGSYPSYPFLKPLQEGPSVLARVQGSHLEFPRTGETVPLDLSALPTQAAPVPPSLLGIPGLPWVAVVRPYYLYQDKEHRYWTEVYSDRGDLLLSHDSLPTHVSLDHPHLLVAPERSGCCESLRWNIRFYDLKKGTVSEYRCPEGFCGDVLFTRLGGKGPYLIAQEIVGRVGGLGASMQTNLFILEPDGRLSASGKILYALRDAQISRPRAESLSPYAVSRLLSVDPMPEKKGWTLRFGEGPSGTLLELTGNASPSPPSVVFLLPKDPSGKHGKTLDVNGQRLGTLPLLAAFAPGLTPFEISNKDGTREAVSREIGSDLVNILMF